ncbi:hypothetical protein B0H19DRAFT_1249479 [Mycena capillaripes]|nr:hypothetical protein B0H19DRAFT_1249479 [Mycena capillaripes]
MPHSCFCAPTPAPAPADVTSPCDANTPVQCGCKHAVPAQHGANANVPPLVCTCPCRQFCACPRRWFCACPATGFVSAPADVNTHPASPVRCECLLSCPPPLPMWALKCKGNTPCAPRTMHHSTAPTAAFVPALAAGFTLQLQRDADAPLPTAAFAPAPAATPVRCEADTCLCPHLHRSPGTMQTHPSPLLTPLLFSRSPPSQDLHLFWI